MQKKKINIVPYDSNWPKIFEIHAKKIKNALGENVVEVYHVGSTSVARLCAKPTIDIMCVVKDLRAAIRPLESIGYECRGAFNLLMRLFFSKRTPNDINLHVLKENSDEIERNLCFRNYLREHKEARDMYADIKLKLLNENPDGFNLLPIGFTDYTTQKDEIIRKIVEMTGFNGFRFTIITTDHEIKTFKALLNLDKIDAQNPNVFNMCLYKGVEIMAAAQIEFYENFSKAKIKKINAIDDQNKIVILDKINEWLEFKGTTLIQGKHPMKDRFQVPCAVFVILERENEGKCEILLQKRQNTGYRDGFWDLAASGHVEHGESLKTATVREAKEEIGIDILEEDLEFACMAHKFFKNEDITYYDVYFKVHKYTGKIEIGEPHKCSELTWFDINELPEKLIDNRSEALFNYFKGIRYTEIGWDI